MKLSKKLIEMIKRAGFTIEQEDKNIYRFGKYSTFGQDFSFSIDTENDLDSFRHNIWEYFLSFDCSYEAYIWLDNEGHGKNGAPYDMKEVYEDMQECESFIDELHTIVTNYIDSIRRKR